MKVSEKKASEIIESIRQGWGCPPSGTVESDTEAHQAPLLQTAAASLMDMLTNDVYGDPCHFILEILQNADDNDYNKKVLPTLNLKLSRERLIIECNEEGFTESDVRAICTVCASTKKSNRTQTGEKGVGFKSCFSIAKRISIFSNGFNFMLDNSNHPLGMVIPVLIPKAQRSFAKAGWTIFVLQLNVDDKTYKRLRDKIDTLDGRLLLFARRLVYFNIYRSDHSVVSHTSTSQSNKRVITTDDHTPGNPFVSYKYIVERFTRRMRLPYPGRTGPESNVTTIVIAFPFGEEPIIEEQKICTFLPLYRTSFPFIINAEFRTQTNREGILTGEPWNEELRGKIIEAFDTGFKSLRNECQFKTSFIEYIPEPEVFGKDPFLQYIAGGIVQNVVKQNIFLSRGGDWITPAEAITLGPDFLVDGEPLFTEEELNLSEVSSTRHLRYLSSEHYTNTRSQTILKVLGIREFNHAFVERIVTNSEFAFHQKPDQWFSRFFAYLFKCPRGTSIFRLPFLKLADNTWVSKFSSLLPFIPNPNVAVPGGLRFRILDRKFWEAVGMNDSAKAFLMGPPQPLQVLTRTAVIARLIEIHRGVENGQFSLTHTELVEQAKYLCLQQFFPAELDDLKRCFHASDTQGRCTSIQDLVGNRTIRWPGGNCSLSSIPSNVRVLHQDYTEDIVSFFDRNLGLPKFPPLLVQFTPPLQGTVSPFYTVHLSPSRQKDNRLLYLLRELWPLLPSDDRKFACGELKNIEVVCENDDPEGLRALYSCALRTIELEQFMSSELNILSVENPNDRSWSFLTELGVMSRPDVRLYLTKLVHLQKKDPASMSGDRVVEMVKGLYEGLVDCNNRNPQPIPSLIQSEFKQYRLLLLCKQGRPPQWVSPNDILLQVPPFARYTPKYPDKQPWSRNVQTFIYQTLDIQHWDDAEHLLPELWNFSAGQRELSEGWNATCRYVFEALKRVQTALPKKGSRVPHWIQRILELGCFPVVRKNDDKVLCRLTGDIFVLDSPSLNTLFKGKIDNLDFEPIFALRQLLQTKLPEQNFLSFHDHDTDIEAQGSIDLLREERQQIREKERYITRLICGERSGLLEKEVREKWEKLKIGICEHLYQRIRLPGMQEFVVVDHRWYIPNAETTTIVLAESSLQPRQIDLGQGLEKYWGLENVAERITIILSQPSTSALDEYLGCRPLSYPELPETWGLGTELPSNTDAETYLMTNSNSHRPGSLPGSITASPTRGINDSVPTSTAPAGQNRPPVSLDLDGSHKVAPRRAAHDFGDEQIRRQLEGDNERPIGFLSPDQRTGNEGISNDMAAAINLSVEDTVRRLSDEETKTQLSSSLNPHPRRRWHNIAIDEIPIVTTGHRALNVTYADSSSHQLNVNEEETSEIHSIGSLLRPRTTPTVRSPNSGLGLGYSHSPSAEEVIARLSGAPSTAAERQVSRWRDLEERAREKEECGYAGEKFVYEFLKRLLGSKFNGDNWTSSNRRFAGFPPCNEGPADFHYEDTDNRLSESLELKAPSPAIGFRKILIEVKSTPRADTKAFFLSPQQFSLAQNIHRKPDSNSVYVIFRVEYALEGGMTRICQIFVDPIKHLADGVIEVSAMKSVVVAWD